jgi:hypothetical protein
MCIFSASVPLVEGTNIFARHSSESKQILVYSMTYESDQDMAMILPLPVGSHNEDTTVRFIALDNYPNFFDDMLSGFPALMPPISKSSFEDRGRSAGKSLKVYEVGDYDASFIPTLNDFDRLDPQFKLSRELWDRLPEYKDYGFAVFKLRVRNQQQDLSLTENNPYADRWSRFLSQPKRPHPMAFEFVTRSPDKLFFPTIHIHDGAVHKEARFDHHLYYQGDDFSITPVLGQEVQSDVRASEFMDTTKAMGLVDGQARCHAIVMSGMFPNQDTVLAGHSLTSVLKRMISRWW